MRLLAAVVVAAAAQGAAACPLAASALQAGTITLAWQADGGPVVVGRHFILQVQVCPAGAALVGVDATMPEHRHGMNYKPGLVAMGGGRWRADGLMFHMAGRWQLRFDVLDAAGKVERVFDDLHLR